MTAIPATFKIRPAQLVDARHLLVVERSAAQAFRAIPALAWLSDAAVTPAEVHRAHIAAGTAWVAAGPDDLPVGFLTATRGVEGLHIDELSVRGRWQNKGCGRALMAAAIAWAKAQGLGAVTLTTFRDVPWNAPFYERLGFRVLAGAALTEQLAAVMQDEAQRGLPAGQRCAMRLVLESPAQPKGQS